MKIQHSLNNSVCGDAWIARDKLHHFTYSALLVCAGSSLSRTSLDTGQRESIRYGVAFSMSAGLTKEIRDMRQPVNHFCWKDVAADLTGIAFGIWIMERWR